MTTKTAILVFAVGIADIFAIWLLGRILRTNIEAVAVIVVSASVLLWWLIDANHSNQSAALDDEPPNELR